MVQRDCDVTIISVTDSQFVHRHNEGIIARCACGIQSDPRVDEAKAREQLKYQHELVERLADGVPADGG